MQLGLRIVVHDVHFNQPAKSLSFKNNT